MSYPTNDVTTVNLNAGTDSIAAARVELFTALTRLGELIDSRNTANGMAPLDANSQVPAANMPTTLTSGGSNDITLQPATGNVVVKNILTLTARTVAELEADDSPVGSIAYVSNGNAGASCLAVSTGAQSGGAYQWLRVVPGVHITAS
jgi:hypothetical protein|tara:strand:- start:18 stop:461 length:444 start_codon:yes stop_codon:yes gene_type:complete